MCMSFTDEPMWRQEEIWVQTHRYAETDTYWARRDHLFGEYLVESYQAMDRADLVAHYTDVKAKHGDDPTWAPVLGALAAVDAEMRARDEMAELARIATAFQAEVDALAAPPAPDVQDDDAEGQYGQLGMLPFTALV